jgi:hypothetical protein
MAIAIPPIPEAEKTPLVLTLLEIIQQLATEVQQLRDEIARLKGHKTRPEVRPSTLEAVTQPAPPQDHDGKRPGSHKRDKTAQLTIHETKTIRPADLPEGARFKGHQCYVVQDVCITPHNTCYLLERWLTPDGRWLVGQLPPRVRALGHFGPDLRALVLYQHHEQQVPQPRILTFVREAGVDISAGQLNRLLTEDLEPFHAEKDELLATGLAVSSYIHVDDTAARHQGHNGFTTHIGNEYFAWFATTGSKSRVNFLELLRGGASDYRLTAEAFAWMRRQELSQEVMRRLEAGTARVFADATAWQQHLEALGVTDERHRQVATEAALLGSALEHGMRPDLVVVSDDAGQFDVWLHALCWVHAERNLNKLVPLSQGQRADLEAVRHELWQLYADLKAYKASPDPGRKEALAARFEAMCARPTCFASLGRALKRLRQNRAELLLVLERPEIPLHNNLSEQDIRDYVTKRKVSGGTRSPLGRRCRDTFISLKKTCRKLGVSFWQYLRDRVAGLGQIPPLGELLRNKARGSPAGRVAISPEPNPSEGFVLA